MTGTDGILGVILAGGQSRRMGAVDKTLMPLAGVPMVERVLRRIRRQLPAVIVNTNADKRKFDSLAIPVVADTVAGYAGPLAGILAGMDYAGRNGFQHICSVAADTPFFPHDFVSSLAEYRNHDIVLASSQGFRQPTFGLWSLALLPDLTRFLADGDERKIMRFVDRHRWTTVAFDKKQANGADPFFNINTPEDVTLAEQYLADDETEHV